MLRMYCYTSTYVGEDIKLDLNRIADVSHENNPAWGLTGALLVHGNRFIQVLEGPPGPVQTLVERLLLDPRHEEMIVLFDEPIPRRSFPAWHMAIQEIVEAELSAAELLAFRSAYLSAFKLDSHDFLTLVQMLMSASDRDR